MSDQADIEHPADSGDDHKMRREVDLRDEQERERKDLRTNRVLMYVSILVTAVSLAAFFWLAGMLEWRGSEGKYVIGVAFDCDKGETPEKFSLAVLLDGEDATILYDLNYAQIDLCGCVASFSCHGVCLSF
jgi:hypothetical protein